MIVVVTGGRDYEDAATVEETLDTLHAANPIATLYHGGARGADRLANVWAHRRGVHAVRFAADWMRHGKAAGPLRNAAMLRDAHAWAKERRRLVLLVAFPGGRGTADCTRQAQALGITVSHVAHQPLTAE